MYIKSEHVLHSTVQCCKEWKTAASGVCTTVVVSVLKGLPTKLKYNLKIHLK